MRSPILTGGLALTVIGTLSLSACGGNDAPAADAEAGAEIWPAKSLEELAPLAAEEGTLNWYTVFTDANSGPIIEAFNKEYPDIEVSTIRLSADKLAARILTEQRGGEYGADVVSGNATYISQLEKAGALQGFELADPPELPGGLELPKGFQGVAYINTSVIAYNPIEAEAEGLTPPTSWEDFTKPEWKGRFSVDPESVDWYDGLIEDMGREKALELVTAIGGNSPRITPNHSQQLTDLQAGSTVAAVAAYGPASAKFAADDPGRIEFVNTDPLPAVLTLTNLAVQAPHPNAAMLFQNWLTSAPGQQVVVKGAGKISVRDDADNNPELWDTKEWAPAWADPSMDPEEYNELTAEFAEAVNE